MNRLYLAASALSFVVGLAHSILGEMLVFRRMRQSGLIPTNGGRIIGEGHVRILWASWHVLTVFGWGFAVILLWLSRSPPEAGTVLSPVIIAAMLAGSLLVLVGTKGKHPGWAGLLGVAVLVWLGQQQP